MVVERRTKRAVSGRELSKKEEREARILDATAELLQKWGYRKTTIEDIARAAGVSKATVYLSWKTREALLMALIEREQRAAYDEIIQRMEEDPEGMTLPGLVKHSILTTFKKPLLKSLVLQDSRFLGELLLREYNETAYQAQMQGYMTVMNLLRKLGVIRDDVDLREQAVMLISVSWGFLLTDPLLPPEFKFASDEEMVERIYRTLQRLLEPDIPPSAEQIREGKRAFKAYMEQVVAILHATESSV